MARYKLQGRAVDSYGNIQPGVGVTIYLAGTTTPAKIYWYESAVSQPDPFETPPQVTTDVYGRFGFWVDTADYPITQLFDIYAGSLGYTDVDIFRGTKIHGDLLNLSSNDHKQYANLTQSERVSGTWIFLEDTIFMGTVNVSGNVWADRLFTKNINPSGAYELVSKNYVDNLTITVSGATIEYVDLHDRAISASSIEGDRRQWEYMDVMFASTSASSVEGDRTLYDRITSVSGSSLEGDNRLYERITSVSGSSLEGDNRLYERITSVSGSSLEWDHRLYERITSVSGSSLEGDNRLYEYINSENTTQTFQLSASIDENINRLTEYTDTMLLSTSAASLEGDRTLREYTDVMFISTSASSRESDSRLDERITSVSGSSLESDNRLYEYIDLKNDTQTLQLSAASQEEDNRIWEDLGHLTGQVRSFEASAGDSLRALQGRMTTHEISAKGLFDEQHGRLISLGASAAERFYKIETIFDDTSEPTGFLNRTDSVITFTDSTSAFSISGAGGGSFDYYIKGTKYTLTGIHTLPVIGGGSNFFYFDENETLNVTQTFDATNMLRDSAYCAAVYWNDNDNERVYMGDERHGITMDWETHAYLHTTEGTRYVSGLSLYNITADSNGNDNSYATFDVSSGYIRDEDLLHTISENTSASIIPVLYREGSNGRWNINNTTIYPVLSYSGGNNLLAWNEFTGGAWTQTEVGDTQYVLAHIFATNDSDNQIVAIQGQNTYTTLTTARTGATTEILSLSIGEMPFAEFLPIATVIYQTDTTYGNDVKARIVSTDEGDEYVDFRAFKGGSTGGTNVDDHGNLSGLSDDDHLLYTKANGTRAFTGTVAGITPTSDTHLTTKLYVDSENDTQTALISAASLEGDRRIQDDLLDYVLTDGSRSMDLLDVTGDATVSKITSDEAFNINTVQEPVAATGVAINGTGLNEGNYRYRITYTTDIGETGTGALSDFIVTSGTDLNIEVTLPISTDSRVTGRKIYRSKSDGLTDVWYVAAVNDNTTTTYIDNKPDSEFSGAGWYQYAFNSTSNYITNQDTRCLVVDDRATLLGYNAGSALTFGGNPTFIGLNAGLRTTEGHFNVAVGPSALLSNIDGSNNVAIGRFAGYLILGDGSVAIGDQALRYLTTGVGNVGVGRRAGHVITTGGYNTFIGNYAGQSASQVVDVDNSIAIGNASYTTKDNQAVIGASTITETLLRGNVGIGTETPSEALDVDGNITVTGTVDGYDISTIIPSLSAASLEGDRRIYEYVDTEIAAIDLSSEVASVSAASVEGDNRLYEYVDTRNEVTSGSIISHIQNLDIHREIDDTSTSTTALWSSTKIQNAFDSFSSSNIIYQNTDPSGSGLGQSYDYLLQTTTGDWWRKDVPTYGTDECNGGTITDFAFTNQNNLFDNNLGTNGYAQTSSTDAWVTYEFTSAKAITRVIITANHIDANRWFDEMYVYGSNTGAFGGEEVELYHYQGEIATPTDQTPVLFDFENTDEYLYIRLFFPEDCNISATGIIQLAEMEMITVSSYDWIKIWDNTTFTNNLSAASVEGDRRIYQLSVDYTDTQITSVSAASDEADQRIYELSTAYTDTQITSVSAASDEADQRIYEYGDANWAGGGGVSLPSGGVAGQVLSKSSSAEGDADWVDISTLLGGEYEHAVLTHSGGTNINVAFASKVSVTWDDEIRLNGSFLHSTSTNSERVSATSDGLYLIIGNVVWDNTGAARVDMGAGISKNGGWTLPWDVVGVNYNYNRGSTYGDNSNNYCLATLPLSAGDYITIDCWYDFQEQATAVNTTANTRLEIYKLTPTKGDTGDTGATGATGDTGAAGADGADGVDGIVTFGSAPEGAYANFTSEATYLYAPRLYIGPSATTTGYFEAGETSPSGTDPLGYNGHLYATRLSAEDRINIGDSFLEAGETSPSGTTALGYNGYFYATRVYNAVYNDIADFQDLDDELVYGKCYYRATEYGMKICCERLQKGVVGIASDTYGYGLGARENCVPLAIGGWVMAYVDGDVESGDALTVNENGNLTKMEMWEKVFWPERIVAIYQYKEEKEKWNDILVNGRHWVKIK